MLLNEYRLNKTEENRKNMIKARSEYKSTLRKRKLSFDQAETEKLERLKFTNAKEYWKVLQTFNTSNAYSSKTLQADIFAEYFKTINNPDSQFYQPDEDVLIFNQRYLDGELQIMFEELNVEISRSEIIKGCKELQCGKAGGPDLLLNEFFKYGIDFYWIIFTIYLMLFLILAISPSNGQRVTLYRFIKRVIRNKLKIIDQ